MTPPSKISRSQITILQAFNRLPRVIWTLKVAQHPFLNDPLPRIIPALIFWRYIAIFSFSFHLKTFHSELSFSRSRLRLLTQKKKRKVGREKFLITTLLYFWQVLYALFVLLIASLAALLSFISPRSHISLHLVTAVIEKMKLNGINRVLALCLERHLTKKLLSCSIMRATLQKEISWRWGWMSGRRENAQARLIFNDFTSNVEGEIRVFARCQQALAFPSEVEAHTFVAFNIWLPAVGCNEKVSTKNPKSSQGFVVPNRFKSF